MPAHKPKTSNALDERTIDSWALLLRSSRTVTEQVEIKLKESGLPPLIWYDVLLEVQRAKPDGLRQFEIGERMLLAKHNLSRLVDRLEKEKLVDRRVCPEDGRGRKIYLTSKGAATVKRMWPAYASAIDQEFSRKLTSAEKRSLQKILAKLL